MRACNHTIAAAHNIIVSIAHLIEGRYADHACGVGGASCRVLGRIPANTVSIIIAGYGESEGCVIEKSPAISVLEDRMLGGENGDKVERWNPARIGAWLRAWYLRRLQ